MVLMHFNGASHLFKILIFFQYFEQSNFKGVLVFTNFCLINAGKEFEKVVQQKWRELIPSLNTIADWDSLGRVVTQTRDQAF